MNVDIGTIKNLGSLIIFIAIIGASVKSITKKHWNEVALIVFLGGLLAYMINTPSTFTQMGKVVWDILIGIMEGGDNNVFKP